MNTLHWLPLLAVSIGLIIAIRRYCLKRKWKFAEDCDKRYHQLLDEEFARPDKFALTKHAAFLELTSFWSSRDGALANPYFKRLAIAAHQSFMLYIAEAKSGRDELEKELISLKEGNDTVFIEGLRMRSHLYHLAVSTVERLEREARYFYGTHIEPIKEIPENTRLVDEMESAVA